MAMLTVGEVGVHYLHVLLTDAQSFGFVVCLKCASSIVRLWPTYSVSSPKPGITIILQSNELIPGNLI